MLHKGFTLIELLVVIAIIGILASVVLGALNDARTGGIEAKIKSEMNAISNRAAIEESRLFTFDIVCGSNGVATSTDITDLISAINTFSESPVVCNSDSEVYAVSAQISSSTHWCIDSSGSAIATSSALGVGDYSCL